MLKTLIGLILVVGIIFSSSVVSAEDLSRTVTSGRIILAKVRAPGKRIASMRVAPLKAANSRIVGEVLAHQSAGFDAMTGVTWSGQLVSAAANNAMKRSVWFPK